VQLETSMADFTQSLPAALAQTAWFWETNEGERVMARQHAGMAVISEGHKEVVNIRIAGAASKCSAGNAIRILIRPNKNTTIRYTPCRRWGPSRGSSFPLSWRELDPVKLVVLVTGLTATKISWFLPPNGSRNHHLYSVHLRRDGQAEWA